MDWKQRERMRERERERERVIDKVRGRERLWPTLSEKDSYNLVRLYTR